MKSIDVALAAINQIYEDMNQPNDTQYSSLYDNVENKELKCIFSQLHKNYMEAFLSMNNHINSHHDRFYAEESRLLMDTIKKTKLALNSLKNTAYEFELEDHYKEQIEKCDDFLQHSYGSPIPDDMTETILYYKTPIFKFINVDLHIKNNNSYQLSLIGEGAYAHVYKYKDKEYNRYVVLKRVKDDLNEEELLRFKQEFQIMKKLSSPYVVEVYRFNNVKYEYTMEYVDYTLQEYIEKNNNKLLKRDRVRLCHQVMRAFQYIHSKDMLHRDISLTNILMKEYDDVRVIKISDFGLVKLPDSNLTSRSTVIKGNLNDPMLKNVGFNNYNIQHEIYAITHVLVYILTGKTNLANIKEPRVRELLERGTTPYLDQRYKNIEELCDNFTKMFG